MSLTSPLAQYAHIRKVGDLYYIAGQGCRDPETNGYAGLTRDASGKITSYDIKAQTRAVFSNIERVLASADMQRGHLVDITVFLTDMADFPQMNSVWNELFESEPLKPTRTTVAVKTLPGDNFIEMKAIAYRGKP